MILDASHFCLEDWELIKAANRAGCVHAAAIPKGDESGNYWLLAVSVEIPKIQNAQVYTIQRAKPEGLYLVEIK